MPEGHAAIDGLQALIKVLDANDERFRYVRGRAEQMESLLAQGYTWQQILSTEERPLAIDVYHRELGARPILDRRGYSMRRQPVRTQARNRVQRFNRMPASPRALGAGRRRHIAC